MKALKVSADRNNLPKVQAFIDEQLEAADCPMATQIAIDVAVEELFINIASYAYGGKAGTAAVQVTIHRDPLSAEITFIDSGKQYAPLAKPDPDVTLPARERKKGGLGIFMVKNSMDDLKYAYKDGQNVLTMIKNLGSTDSIRCARRNGSFSVILHQKSLPCVSKPADFLYNLPKKSLVPSHTPIESALPL